MVGTHITIESVHNGYILKESLYPASGGPPSIVQILIYQSQHELLTKVGQIIFEKEVSVEVKEAK